MTFSAQGIRDILVREGIHPPYTQDINSAAVYPGLCLTATGETAPNVSVADAIADNVVGIAGCLENQDIDSVYTTGTEIPVYRTGHGAIVWVVHAANGGSVVDGDIMVCQTVETNGHVEPFHKAIAKFIAAAGNAAGTILATQITHIYSIIGRAQETHASTGTAAPIKVILSV